MRLGFPLIKKAPWRLLAASVTALAVSAAFVSPAAAVVANDDPIQITQPNGKVFTAHIYGDETQGWIETSDGYTILPRPLSPPDPANPFAREWVYADGTSGRQIHAMDATANPDVVVDPDKAPPSGLEKHLRPPKKKDHKSEVASLPSVLAGLNGSHLATWTPTPVSGSRQLLIILVNFADRALTTTANDWNDAIFSTTPGVKSVANFYKDNSFGTLSVSPYAHTQAGNPAGIVTVTISNNHPDYADNYTKATEAPWLKAALAAAAPFVDYSTMDSNNDGVISQSECVIYFIPAGYDASGSSKHPNVWAHAWSGNEVTVDGKTLQHWAMNGELNDASRRHPMGVIAHELGHQMCGLPDLYDPDYKNNGLGGFSLMSFGSWGKADADTDSGETPVAMDAWCREYLGWSTVRIPGSSGPVSFPPPLDTTNSPLKIVKPSASTTEYFLVENRYPKSWDLGLEKYLGKNWGGALLIEHVDNNIGSPANNDINLYVTGQHQGVVAVEATTTNGSILSVPPANQGTIDDVFFDPQNSTFLNSTTPSSKLYDGTKTDLGLCDISAKAEVMTAQYVDCTTAKVTACIFRDSNANGVKDPGEGGDFTNWEIDWTVCGASGTGTIASGQCVDLFDDQPPCSTDVQLKVSVDGNGNFNDPTGTGKRWKLTTPISATVTPNCSTPTVVEFGVVQLGTITAHKFDDASMNGAQDGSEAGIAGWPFRLTGKAINGADINLTGSTDATGDYVFRDLLPSDATGYAAREDLTWESAQPCATDGYSVNRTSHAGKRWQATTAIEQISVLGEGQDLNNRFGNVCLGTLSACVFYDKNMSGTRETVAESYTDINGNGKWDPAELYGDLNNNGMWDPAEPYVDKNHNGRYDSGEPFTDLNGNLCWDDAEPLRDENGNGVWDPAEPFVDSFANGVWDDAEETQPNWPVTVCGTSADGRCIGPIKTTTDAGGCIDIKDIPPGSYKIYQDSEWCDGSIDWCAGAIAPQPDRLKSTHEGRRWLATTPVVHSIDYAECADVAPFEFGNVCLASITGTLSLKNCPDSIPDPLEGWQVCLKVAKVEPTLTFMPLPLMATDPDCQSLVYNCTNTKSDGSFRFGELAPGIYKISESGTYGYAPVGSAVDRCVPFRVKCEDVTQDLAVRDTQSICPLYQAYPARSLGASPVQLASVEPPPGNNSLGQTGFAGYAGKTVDPISAIGGVFEIDPGSKWANFVNATAGCASYCLKNVVLQKEHAALRQCYDVFAAGPIGQQGTPNVRLWWPLMYEPPGTTWTLTILYGTPKSVKLPGERNAGFVHRDQWRWRVEVTLDSLDTLLDAFHTVPFGLDQVPLISDENAYAWLKGKMAQAKAAPTQVEIADILSQIELQVADMCLSQSPAFPAPSGPGTGVANTRENPAGCKILADIDFLLKNYGRQ
ncbi:MAG: M6 family metalloprotease domain-containing protein [Armatimonadetes bacterium]|nr:M6 family metalloprotease domain-containing protein [Armatimonadota bacterium]